MPTRVRSIYRPNRGVTGIVGIATSPRMRSALAGVALLAQRHAEALAPRDSGRYASSFKRRELTVYKGNRKRAAVELVNTAPYAASVEFGTQPSISAGVFRPGTRPQRVLGRTQSWLRARG